MRTRRISLTVVSALLVAAVMAVVAYAATNSSSWDSHWGMMGNRYAYRPAKATPVHTIGEARTEAQKLATRLNLRVDEVLQFKRNFYAKLVDAKGNGATEVLVDPTSGIVSVEYGPAMMWNTKYGMMNRTGLKMMGRYGQSMMGAGGMMGNSGNGGGMMGGNGGGMMGGTGSGNGYGYGYGYGYGMMGGSGNANGHGPGMMGGSGNANGHGPGMMGGTGSGSTSTTSTTTKVSLARAHTLAQNWLNKNESGVTVETGGDTFPGYYTMETLKNGKITGMISVNATSGTVWPHWWHGDFVAKSA